MYVGILAVVRWGCGEGRYSIVLQLVSLQLSGGAVEKVGTVSLYLQSVGILAVVRWGCGEGRYSIVLLNIVHARW